MHFLKTLFWVLVAVLVALFAGRNWAPVTLNLWGDIQADIKIPVLLLICLPARLPSDLADHARPALVATAGGSKRSSAAARHDLPVTPSVRTMESRSL